jgi:hypothetical protein
LYFVEGKEGEKKDQQEIIWDDSAVEALLYRDHDATATKQPDAVGEGGEKKEHWANEYLSSFKVAQYVTREADEDAEEDQVCDHQCVIQLYPFIG